MQWFERMIANNFFRLRPGDDEEANLYIMSMVANFFALMVHFFLLIVFAACGDGLFTLIGVGSVCCFAGAFWLVARRKYIHFGLLLSIEVTLYATLFSIRFGLDTYAVAYFMLVVIMQVIVPYGTMRLRLTVTLCTVLCITGSVAAGILWGPVSEITSGLRTFLTVANIYILVIGTILELMVDSIAKLILSHIKDMKMEELTSQAHTDQLTGLYNRRYAQLFFDSYAQRGQCACVAIVDIDDFKCVNDTHGHAAGDAVLVFLARFLVQNLRRTDLVFRWGGEEFLIVMMDTELPMAVRVLEKLRHKLEQSIVQTETAAFHITITAGVADLRCDAIEQSIARSDARLYEGKHRGKNRVSYEGQDGFD